MLFGFLQFEYAIFGCRLLVSILLGVLSGSWTSAVWESLEKFVIRLLCFCWPSPRLHFPSWLFQVETEKKERGKLWGKQWDRCRTQTWVLDMTKQTHYSGETFYWPFLWYLYYTYNFPYNCLATLGYCVIFLILFYDYRNAVHTVGLWVCWLLFSLGA